MLFSPAGGANSAPPNPLAGLEGPLLDRGRWGEKEGREGERKARTGMERRKKHPPKYISGYSLGQGRYTVLMTQTTVVT